jgi:hypothetical protein
VRKYHGVPAFPFGGEDDTVTVTNAPDIEEATHAG